MDHATTWRSTRARVLIIATLSVAALSISGALAASASAETTWLCRPGLAHNPCLNSLETTVQLSNGKSFVETPQPAANPPIDCFYVYPTVSSQFTVNATETIEPEEEAIAESQASRFSQVCKVYAPMYPQITVPALIEKTATQASVEKAFFGVLAGFEEYLTKYNDGRGFVLIGHSQGSAMLELLMKDVVEKNPALEAKLVSAVILGGQVVVPGGKNAGGTFQNTPLCASILQAGCVIAYSSFLKEPPNPSLFGRTESSFFGLVGGPPTGVENPQVACVNPTVPVLENLTSSFTGSALSYYPTKPFPGLLGPYVQTPKGSTPWVATPGEYLAQCRSTNGATWLQLTPSSEEDTREPRLAETLGPEWGTHLVDVNVTLGNLVPQVRVQGLVWGIQHPLG